MTYFKNHCQTLNYKYSSIGNQSFAAEVYFNKFSCVGGSKHKYGTIAHKCCKSRSINTEVRYQDEIEDNIYQGAYEGCYKGKIAFLFNKIDAS